MFPGYKPGGLPESPRPAWATRPGLICNLQAYAEPGVYPLGERPVGYIFYNHDGYMSVEIMAEGRVPYQEPDVFGGTPQERSEAISTYLSYTGPFEVLPDRDTVIHHIEVARIRTGSATPRCVSRSLRETCWCSAPSR
jgi:hypothetical protein